MKIRFKVNGSAREVDADPQTPLLWVLRDQLGLTGTKFGCGVAECGACTVHLDGEAVRSCVTPIEAVDGAAVKTIEGLDPQGKHPVQQAWVELAVPQCGYCQSGQIMAAAALYSRKPRPSAKAAEAEMAELLCRCGTYPRIRAALGRLFDGDPS